MEVSLKGKGTYDGYLDAHGLCGILIKWALSLRCSLPNQSNLNPGVGYSMPPPLPLPFAFTENLRYFLAYSQTCEVPRTALYGDQQL